MMRPTSAWSVLMLLCLLAVGCSHSGNLPPEPVSTPTPVLTSKNVTLVMGSWRPEDVEQMNHILAKFHEAYPQITIRFDPTPAPDYDEALQAQLRGGTAPDLFYLRSYSVSRDLFDQGYLEVLNDVPGLKTSFSPAVLVPWSTDQQQVYGIPFIATSHGIYYNQDLFRQLNLQVPKTWEELLITAQVVKEAGYIPFANASGDPWTVAEIIFMNLAPNFIGGYEGRMAYLTGERCFNDAHMVAAFQAVADLVPYLPPNQEVLKYADSQQLFLQGKAAMFFSGSWEIPFFETVKPSFTWGVFAPPPPLGQPGYVTFHLDAGMGLNKVSKYKEEARKFLEWMTKPEFAALLGNELPGFFPLHSQVPPLQNQHANEFITINQNRPTDVRFAWEKLRDGFPDAYTLIQDGAVAVLNKQQTPQQAADALQSGLVQWFAPAQHCNP